MTADADARGWPRIRRDLRHAWRARAHVARHPSELRTVARWLQGAEAPLEVRRPWWPQRVVSLVARELPATARVFEYGSGGSTLWLAARSQAVVSVEHDPHWAEVVRRSAPANVTVLLRPPAPAGVLASDSADGFFDEFVAAIDDFDDEGFDLVIVDGRCRVACVHRSRRAVRPGGMLLLDDSDRPKYADAHAALAAWPAVTVSGLKLGARDVVSTTVWRRPTSA